MRRVAPLRRVAEFTPQKPQMVGVSRNGRDTRSIGSIKDKVLESHPTKIACLLEGEHGATTKRLENDGFSRVAGNGDPTVIPRPIAHPGPPWWRDGLIIRALTNEQRVAGKQTGDTTIWSSDIPFRRANIVVHTGIPI